MKLDDTVSIKVTNNSSSSVSVSGSSSKSSELQVWPNQAQTISAKGSATFQIQAKKTGLYIVTFTSGCDTKTVAVLIVSKLTIL